jgi:hypothetical protein
MLSPSATINGAVTLVISSCFGVNASESNTYVK